MAAAKGISNVGRTIVLILSGAAVGTLMGLGIIKYDFFQFLKPLVDPLLTINFPLGTYVDFFFLTLHFGFTLKISATSLLGGLVGYWVASRW